jgi:uncharacterized membrane protein
MSVLHSPPCAKDIRAIARKNLEGQWPLAVLVTFLAGLLGGQHGFSGGTVSVDLPHAEIPLEHIGDPQMWEKLLEELTTQWPAIVFAMVTSLAISAVFFIIGPCIHWGLCRFRLALVDGEQPTVGMLFQGFKSVFLKALGVQVLQSLIILACVLPFMLAGGITAGILILQLPRIHAYYLALTICVLLGLAGGVLAVIVQYRYAMSYYALVDNPELRATDALRESARMMKGNKWSFFCLNLSFIGWAFLCLFSCGIGSFILTPYSGQAEAVFYHHVSGRAAIREAVEELSFITEGL